MYYFIVIRLNSFFSVKYSIVHRWIYKPSPLCHVQHFCILIYVYKLVWCKYTTSPFIWKWRVWVIASCWQWLSIIFIGMTFLLSFFTFIEPSQRHDDIHKYILIYSPNHNHTATNTMHGTHIWSVMYNVSPDNVRLMSRQ